MLSGPSSFTSVSLAELCWVVFGLCKKRATKRVGVALLIPLHPARKILDHPD